MDSDSRPETDSAQPDRHRPIVLVVDDDAIVRRFVGRTLRRAGCAVLEAADAIDGLGIFRAHAPNLDLAIVDFMMPHISGLDLAAEIDRHHPGFRILYTSGSMNCVAMKCIAHEKPEAVLPKPFTQSTLMARVKGLVNGLEESAPKPDAGSLPRAGGPPALPAAALTSSAAELR